MKVKNLATERPTEKRQRVVTILKTKQRKNPKPQKLNEKKHQKTTQRKKSTP